MIADAGEPHVRMETRADLLISLTRAGRRCGTASARLDLDDEADRRPAKRMAVFARLESGAVHGLHQGALTSSFS